LLALGVPYPFLWGLWVALVDFLPIIGGALAGIPTIFFALIHSLTAGIVTLIVFVVYTQIESHVLNPMVMSRTVRINPLLVQQHRPSRAADSVPAVTRQLVPGPFSR
jgi:predicted PurR-regulated permease PerM